jgi:hypothetical protein
MSIVLNDIEDSDWIYVDAGLGVSLTVACLDTADSEDLVVHASGSAGIGLREIHQAAFLGHELDAEDALATIRECAHVHFVEYPAAVDRFFLLFHRDIDRLMKTN